MTPSEVNHISAAPINLFGVIARISCFDPHIFRYKYDEFVTIKFQIASLLHPVTEVIDLSTSFGLILLIFIALGGVRSHLTVTEIVLQLSLCICYYSLIGIARYQKLVCVCVYCGAFSFLVFSFGWFIVFLLSLIYPKIPSFHGYKNTNLTEVGTIPSEFSIYQTLFHIATRSVAGQVSIQIQCFLP